MKLEFKEVKERNSKEERVVLIANEDCNLGYYFIFNTKRLPENKISTNVTHPFWFPNKQLKKGDLVVIYTKQGKSSFKLNEDLTTSHFYYRNLANSILGNGEIVLVVEVSTWKAETF